MHPHLRGYVKGVVWRGKRNRKKTPHTHTHTSFTNTSKRGPRRSLSLLLFSCSRSLVRSISRIYVAPSLIASSITHCLQAQASIAIREREREGANQTIPRGSYFGLFLGALLFKLLREEGKKCDLAVARRSEFQCSQWAGQETGWRKKPPDTAPRINRLPAHFMDNFAPKRTAFWSKFKFQQHSLPRRGACRRRLR